MYGGVVRGPTGDSAARPSGRGRARLALAAALAALAGCGDGEPPAALDAGVELAADPAVARFEAVELAARGCDGLAQAARAIGAWRGGADDRVALLEAAAEAGRELCSPDDAVARLVVFGGGAGRLLWAALVEGARERAAAALRLAPASPARDRLLGEQLWAGGDTAAAIAFLERAAADSEAARRSLVRALAGAGDVARAAELARALPADDADDAALAVRALAAAGQLDDAAARIASAPLPWRATMAEAAAAVADPLELAGPGAPPELLLAAGERLLELERPGDAAALLSRAAREVPDSADIALRLGDAAAAAGDTDAAVAAYDRAAELLPAPTTARERAVEALAAAGRLPEARARAGALWDAAAGDAAALVRAATALATAGDREAAVKAAREAAEASPGEGRYAYELANMLAAAGHHREAALAYARLLACGARGKPYHRHEVAGRLVAAARAAGLDAAALAPRLDAGGAGCEIAAPADLLRYARGALEALETPAAAAETPGSPR